MLDWTLERMRVMLMMMRNERPLRRMSVMELIQNSSNDGMSLSQTPRILGNTPNTSKLCSMSVSSFAMAAAKRDVTLKTCQLCS